VLKIAKSGETALYIVDQVRLIDEHQHQPKADEQIQQRASFAQSG